MIALSRATRFQPKTSGPVASAAWHALKGVDVANDRLIRLVADRGSVQAGTWQKAHGVQVSTRSGVATSVLVRRSIETVLA